MAWARIAVGTAGLATLLAAAPTPASEDAPPAWEFVSHDAF